MAERPYRWRRNKQLIFLAAYLVILVGAVWLLTQRYPTAWLLVIVAVLGALQAIFILRTHLHKPGGEESEHG